MYNQQPPQQVNNTNNGQQMHPTNPNGGYAKEGQTPDQWYGNLTITPELLVEIQRTGKVRINMNEPKTNQYGIARRMTAKPYTEVQRPQGGFGNNNGFNQAPAQPQYQAPVQQQYQAQAPAQAPAPAGNNGFHDDIPF